MDYVIKNYKNVFIRLDRNGSAMSCSESDKQLFEYSKARNICDSLPKTLKKMQFKVEAIPDIPTKSNNIKQKICLSNDCKPPDSVACWLEKFSVCSDVIQEATKRNEYLHNLLSNYDKEMSNLLHIIELDSPKDLYHGWLLYKNIRENRKKRREVKDEILILSNILNTNLKNLSMENVEKMINGLSNRKFAMRIIDDEEV